MKKYNLRKSIAEKGGLMIEALAMLGLIAVVTPTMYKKSAERTMEVEDINTATSIRTIVNAADAYVAANYGTLIDSGMAVNTVQASQLKNYLPYNFDVDKALYNYGTPVIKVHKNGTNLTTFVLFPAEADAEQGVGQERTAKIASLIGANGGYVNGENTARGIGGIWSLDNNQYNTVFGAEGTGAHQYSIVTASSETITEGSGGGKAENDKYLSRVNTPNLEWENTMRTDIYMGGFEEYDPRANDGEAGKTHSIRNIKSLIVGIDKIAEGEDRNYGLYLNGNEGMTEAGSHSAYIGGALRAGLSNFFAGMNLMGYGYQQDAEGYRFEVNPDGDIKNTGNLNLATEFFDAGDIKIGYYDSELTSEFDNAYVIRAKTHSDRGAQLSLLDPGMFVMYGKNTDTEKSRLILGRDGYKGVYVMSGEVDEEGNEVPTSNAIENVRYNVAQEFPVKVGSNMQVDGLLSAAQVDTNKLRTSTLSVGSIHVDDQYQWLKVDANGVNIEDTDHTEEVVGNQVKVNNNVIALRRGKATNVGISPTDANNRLTTDHQTQLLLRDRENRIGDNSEHEGELFAGASSIVLDAHGIPGTNGYHSGEISIRNDLIETQIANNELKISGSENLDYRITVDDGNVDLLDSNFKIMRTDEDDNIRSIFAIRGNDYKEEAYSESYNDNILYGNNTEDMYDAAFHGDVIFTNEGELVGDTRVYTKHMSVGKYDPDAGVNIVTNSGANSEGNVFVVDQTIPVTASGDDTVSIDRVRSELNGTGAVYVRKGFLEVIGDDSDGNSANDGAGIIKASRFVANNDYDGAEAYKVPDLLKDEEYSMYNANNKTNRYDTYMVNPAYTSVMHDIKLTTRGGARLSDILPDFINKGIYIVNNSKKDIITEFKITDAAVDKGVLTAKVGGKSDAELVYKDGELTTTTSWGSPYTGIVPAPQCPPGYMRVLTVSPSNFQMAQAGSLSQNETSNPSSNHQNSYYVDEGYMAPPDGTLGTLLKDSAKLPKYSTVNIKPAGENSVSMTVTDETTASTTKLNNTKLSVSNIEGLSAQIDYQSKDEDGNTVNVSGPAYVFSTATDKTLRPFVFQQSTWLKTAQVPVIVGQTTSLEDTLSGNISGGYVSGWAVLMGFLYPSDRYKDVVDSINNVAPEYKKSTTDVMYWNVFPVKRKSLEGFASTYCYFDRTGIYPESYNNDVSGEYIDQYDNMNNVSTSYVKQNADGYLERLNDPSLKYDEIW